MLSCAAKSRSHQFDSSEIPCCRVVSGSPRDRAIIGKFYCLVASIRNSVSSRRSMRVSHSSKLFPYFGPQLSLNPTAWRGVSALAGSAHDITNLKSEAVGALRQEGESSSTLTILCTLHDARIRDVDMNLHAQAKLHVCTVRKSHRMWEAAVLPHCHSILTYLLFASPSVLVTDCGAQSAESSFNLPTKSNAGNIFQYRGPLSQPIKNLKVELLNYFLPSSRQLVPRRYCMQLSDGCNISSLCPSWVSSNNCNNRPFNLLLRMASL